ncbi:uncharacterized protein KY384_006713 [Bacidia gigantensis]|uniref:uncharacterized protein n=1 Tax=Bacidia gigantensis TaxID=2732470 RepID=UPI001D038DD1|nr:uncharacterized protein KY384_006713 [Bacidia gigantensis]KAG8529023.1 hypothetical protein KY384_006713 [Bacidia gigantensis]
MSDRAATPDLTRDEDRALIDRPTYKDLLGPDLVLTAVDAIEPAANHAAEAPSYITLRLLTDAEVAVKWEEVGRIFKEV